MKVFGGTKKWALLVACCAVVGTLAFAGCGSDEEEGAAPPAPAEPAPAEPAPAEPPTEPAPAEPAPTETAPAEPAEPTEAFPSSDIPATDPLKIHFVESIVANEFAQAQIEEIEALVAEHGDTVDISDANLDPQKQFSNCQDAVASGQYDALIIQSIDQVGIVPCVEEAIAAGIIVGATENPIGPSGETPDPQIEGMCCSAFNPFPVDGQAAADLIIQACGDLDPCKVAYYYGFKIFAYDAGRIEVIKAILADHPNIQIVFEGEAMFNYDLGYELTQDLLQAHPDVNVIASNGGQAGFGALNALADAGVTGVQTVSAGLSNQDAQAIRDGVMFGSTVLMPRTSIRAIYTMIKQTVAGEPIADNGLSDGEDLSPIGPSATADNIGDFEGEFSCGVCVLN